MGRRLIKVSTDVVRRCLGGIEKVEIERLNWPIFNCQSTIEKLVAKATNPISRFPKR